MNVSYRIVSPDFVEVNDQGRVVWATKQGALDAIKNIQRQRDGFLTEEEYNRALELYRGAVRALDNEGDES